MSAFIRIMVFAGALMVYMGAISDAQSVVAHYGIKIPVDYGMRDVTPQFADFQQVQIYNLDDRGQVLDLYIGNHPSFPMFRWGADLPGQGAATKNQSYGPRAADGAYEGLLVYTGLAYGGHESPFTHIHFFSKGASAKSALRFKEIISSITVRTPRLP